MPSDLGLHAIQEGLKQAGFGGVLPFLPFLLLGLGGVLIYFGFAWLPKELSERSELWDLDFPLLYRVMGPYNTTPALGMIIVGGWLLYLAYLSSSSPPLETN